MKYTKVVVFVFVALDVIVAAAVIWWHAANSEYATGIIRAIYERQSEEIESETERR